MDVIRCTRKIWIILVIIVVPMCWSTYQAAVVHGANDLGVFKMCEPDVVVAGEPVTCTIHVEGYTGEVTDPIPFDGVLVIDQSGSMAWNDENDLRIDAADSFVDCVAEDTLLGIVRFSDDAAISAGLTNNKQFLHDALDNLRGNLGVETNMYEAMQMAQQMLSADLNPAREHFIILLTDGCDSLHTDSALETLAGVAADNGIICHTVALGSQACSALLYTIADLTGGTRYESPTAGDLAGLYNQICESTSRQARTREVILDEYVQKSSATPVYVVPGSFRTSVTGITLGQILQFEQTGHISVPMGVLGSGEEKTITFQVASDCLTPESEPGTQVEVMIDEDTSYVSYTYGQSQQVTKPVPQDSFSCFAPGDLWVEKSFNANAMQLKLTVENKWYHDPTGGRDNSVQSIVIIDHPSHYFQPDRSTAMPPADGYAPGAEVDAILWLIPVLAPKEVREFSVNLTGRECSANYTPPIPVNAEKKGQLMTVTRHPRMSWSPNFAFGSGLFYRAPDGQRTWLPIMSIKTTLPMPEQCGGRHDLFIQPAEDVLELTIKLTNSPPLPVPPLPRYVRPWHDSPGIWIDSQAENGLWDGASANISDYVDGAVSTDYVPGQGDLFHNNATNVVYVQIENTSIMLGSPYQANGLTLDVYNGAMQRWDTLGSVDIDPLQPKASAAVPVTISPNSLKRVAHVRPYRLSLTEALSLMREANSGYTRVVEAWLGSHASVAQSLAAQGPLTPNDVVAALPEEADPCGCDLWDLICRLTCDEHYLPTKAQFESFLRVYDLAWGKPCVHLRASASAVPPEKHTTNNSGSEFVILAQ